MAQLVSIRSQLCSDQSPHISLAVSFHKVFSFNRSEFLKKMSRCVCMYVSILRIFFRIFLCVVAHHSPFCFCLLALNFLYSNFHSFIGHLSAFHLASHKNDLTDYQISQMLFSMDEDTYELFILISCSPFANVYTCLKLLSFFVILSHTLLHLRTQRLAF